MRGPLRSVNAVPHGAGKQSYVCGSTLWIRSALKCTGISRGLYYTLWSYMKFRFFFFFYCNPSVRKTKPHKNMTSFGSGDPVTIIEQVHLVAHTSWITAHLTAMTAKQVTSKVFHYGNQVQLESSFVFTPGITTMKATLQIWVSTLISDKVSAHGDKCSM